MPLYVYACPRCEKTREDLKPIERRHETPECHCGSRMEHQMAQVRPPKFGFGVRGHYSKEANALVRPSVRGSNDGYEG